jgi:hypothetical protein
MQERLWAKVQASLFSFLQGLEGENSRIPQGQPRPGRRASARGQAIPPQRMNKCSREVEASLGQSRTLPGEIRPTCTRKSLRGLQGVGEVCVWQTRPLGGTGGPSTLTSPSQWPLWASKELQGPVDLEESGEPGGGSLHPGLLRPLTTTP